MSTVIFPLTFPPDVMRCIQVIRAGYLPEHARGSEGHRALQTEEEDRRISIARFTRTHGVRSLG